MSPLPPVILEDDALIAFDKPGGLLIAPNPRDRSAGSLMETVRARYGDHVAIVHRIDPEASGLVLCAKTKPALDFLSGQFQSKTVVKRHLALTSALPEQDEFSVDLVLKEDEGAPGRMCVVKKHGLTAVTEFRVLEKFTGRFALMECRPLTGRMHQIRVHLAASGLPVLNDPLYGDGAELKLSDLKRGYKGRDDEKPLIRRLALHAAGLTFLHPLTREPLTLEAPLPDDLAVALKYLRKFADARTRAPR